LKRYRESFVKTKLTANTPPEPEYRSPNRNSRPTLRRPTSAESAVFRRENCQILLSVAVEIVRLEGKRINGFKRFFQK